MYRLWDAGKEELEPQRYKEMFERERESSKAWEEEDKKNSSENEQERSGKDSMTRNMKQKQSEMHL